MEIGVGLDGGTEDANVLSDTYAAYLPTGTGDAVLIRFQWQLAL